MLCVSVFLESTKIVNTMRPSDNGLNNFCNAPLLIKINARETEQSSNLDRTVA